MVPLGSLEGPWYPMDVQHSPLCHLSLVGSRSWWPVSPGWPLDAQPSQECPAEL